MKERLHKIKHAYGYPLKHGIEEAYKAAKPALHLASEGVAELLWPTRCVLCDVPGTLLCDECRLEIPYIDPLDACPHCGQAHGRLVCTDCNSYRVEHRGLHSTLESGEPVLDAVRSVFQFTDPCTRLITIYKDRKEIRMAKVLAEMLADYVNPAWLNGGSVALVVIPARKQALRERGFDHMLEIGKHLSFQLGLPLLDLLRLNERADQRGLSAERRAKNMRGSFYNGLNELPPTQRIPLQLQHKDPLPHTVVLVDDVLTTGATLTSAGAVLKKMGIESVYGLTLGRLP